MRGIAENQEGKRFGFLKVLGRAGSDAQGNAMWSCDCDCGTTIRVRSAFLKRGQTYCSKQCPLYQSTKRGNIKGQKFGRLSAEALIRMDAKSGKAIWRFSCECGNAVEIPADAVLSGNSKSCGCLGIESRITHGLSHTRAYHNAATKAWAEKYPGKALANVKRRRSDFVLRIPKWLTDSDWEKIDAVYREAARLTRETGVKHHVDHKIPLRGKTVSGLHVPSNLQPLTQEENLRKSRRLLDEVC